MSFWSKCHFMSINLFYCTPWFSAHTHIHRLFQLPKILSVIYKFHSTRQIWKKNNVGKILRMIWNRQSWHLQMLKEMTTIAVTRVSNSFNIFNTTKKKWSKCKRILPKIFVHFSSWSVILMYDIYSNNV